MKRIYNTFGELFDNFGYFLIFSLILYQGQIYHFCTDPASDFSYLIVFFPIQSWWSAPSSGILFPDTGKPAVSEAILPDCAEEEV